MTFYRTPQTETPGPIAGAVPDGADGVGAGTVAPGRADSAATRTAARLFDAIVSTVSGVVRAEPETIRLAVGCVAAGGHLLVEDFPGLGKTTLAKALARALGLGFHRIQCTADLLPADITGAMVLDLERRQPTFRRGPIFTNVLMADELNRASPRAQSALLEAMEERQVTVDGESFALPQPFMVVATQNPYDAAGTSPLPHGQRDRFLLRLSLGYPSRADEEALVEGDDPARRASTLAPALDNTELHALMQAVHEVHLSPSARVYIVDLVAATRTHPAVAVGASPRAAMSLAKAARAMAVSHQRSYITPQDIQAVAVPALAHRLLLRPGADLSAQGPQSVVNELLELVPLRLVDGET